MQENNSPLSRDKYVRIQSARLFKSRQAFVLDFLKGKKLDVLDVGNLGDGGPHANAVRTLVENEGGTYTGLDVNENLAKKLGYDRQIIGDLHNLSSTVSNDEFDCIYAGEIIEHTWTPGKIIQECARIIKDGGYLVLDTPNVYDLIDVARVYLQKKDTMGDVPTLTYAETKDAFHHLRKEKMELYTQPQHKIFYSPAALRQLLNMHGFALEDISYIGKPRGVVHAVLLELFPQASQNIGIIAQKKSVDDIFHTHQFGDPTMRV